jgi:hypothetical protein
MWTATKSKTPAQNALRHFKDHGADFGAKNAFPILLCMAFPRTWTTSIHPKETIWRCRVCGLWQSEPPWGEEGTCPTYDYCPCCGVEFGYGDASAIAIQQWRETWIKDGAKWAEPEKKPAHWNLQEQLTFVTDRFC